MMWIQTKRVLRSGLTSFWRNGVVSLSSVLMMILTLMVISALVFSSVLLQSALNEIKSKVDVNVYFEPQALEDQILAVKSALEKLPEVSAVDYIARDAALEEFRADNENNPSILLALAELPENPLGAVLNVRAKEPSQYASVNDYLTKNYPEDGSIVYKVNYNENQKAINRLNDMIVAGKQLGSALTIIFILISIVITFNTIRLTIYIARDEIHVMKLVGATNSYVRGPFIVVGAFYGLVSALIALIIIIPGTWWFGPSTSKFFGGMNIFDYYLGNIFSIALILIGSGIAIGALSSYLAVRKYLK